MRLRTLLLLLILPCTCIAQDMQQVGRFLLTSGYIDYSERREIVRVLEYVLANHGYALADQIGENTPRMQYIFYLSYEPTEDSNAVENIDIRLSSESLRMAFNSELSPDDFDFSPLFKDLETRLKSRIPTATILTWHSRTEKRDGFNVGKRKFKPEDFKRPVIKDPESAGR